MGTRMGAERIPGEAALAVERDALYGGSWDRMLADLRLRLTQRPYIFKLFERIREDVATVEAIMARGKK